MIKKIAVLIALIALLCLIISMMSYHTLYVIKFVAGAVVLVFVIDLILDIIKWGED